SPVEADHPGAIGQQSLGGRLAQSRIAAGDDRDLAWNLHLSPLVPACRSMTLTNVTFVLALPRVKRRVQAVMTWRRGLWPIAKSFTRLSTAISRRSKRAIRPLPLGVARCSTRRTTFGSH